MSDDLPRAVLSEHVQERMRNRRLVSAIFTTFRLEPGFFESEVLPAFFDIPLSHTAAIKLVQLEEALRSLPGTLAVYYDRHGLVADGGPAKLDIRRFPIRHRSGIFHPKNVLALVEDAEPDDEGRRNRALLCACMSANLTRAGWWENVEVAHFEEIREGEHTSLQKSLLEYVNALVAAVEGQRANDSLRASHGAARDIHDFLRGTTQREHRSANGRLLPHFHGGDESLPDFIEEVAGKSLKGLCLEVISPYFDGGATSRPLEALLQTFEPREVRVFLPRNDRGDGLCNEGLYAWVRAQEGVSWGALPEDLLRLGKAEEVKRRTVHAKVYRFFEPKRGGREVLYVGSTNLTTAGCRIAGKGGNWETGFLVEVTGNARPDWWLRADSKRPTAFAPREEDEGTSTSGGTSLLLRYRWDTAAGSACWSHKSPSPALSVLHGGVTVLELSNLEPGVWLPLSPVQNEQLELTLRSTSLLEVVGDGPEPGLLLVQEEGMSHRPSLLLDLSAADILRYWSLLSVEQRAAFIDARVITAGDDDPLVTKLAPLPIETTLFDRFAGIFHAFECLREHTRVALAAGRDREADYRIFGKKYDSLGSLLDRVLRDVVAGVGDRVEQYVVTLCTKQILDELRKDHPAWWANHRDDVKELNARLAEAAALRASIAAGGAEMPTFLDWFDRWFLARAETQKEEETA